MLHNHVTIHIFVTIAKKERADEFLVPLQVLSFITSNTVRNNTIRKPLLRKKSSVKRYCDNDFAKTNCDILIHEQCRLLKLATASQYWIKFTGDHEATSMNHSRVTTGIMDQTPAHWKSTILSTEKTFYEKQQIDQIFKNYQ